MRMPDFLIIGAMKAGTTSLFFDLGTHPSVFLPEDKEPKTLAGDQVLSEAGRRAYAGLFAGAGVDQICGEASTDYSKLPDVAGVARRARRVAGEALKILYLVREPVARTLSHHHHEVTAGTMEADVDRAVRTWPQLIDYSRYAMQIRPWLDVFGDDQVRVVRFESYVADRPATVAELCGFLGIPERSEGVDVETVVNASARARAPRGPVWRFSRGDFYRTWIRPWLSRSMRTRLRRLTTPKAAPRPAPPRADTVDYILERVAGDAAELQRLTASDEPFWDLEEVRRSRA